MPYWPPNMWAFLVLQAVLAGFTMWVGWKDAYLAFFASGVTTHVKRSEKASKMLYAVYATALAALWAVINSVSTINGHEAAVMLLDFVAVTYLFASTSFRENIFFPIAKWLRWD